MLKLILDHDYRTAPPAVDTSPFSNHGRCIGVNAVADGVAPGSGALEFTQTSSAVRIPRRASWQKLTAFAIEAWINVESTGTRRNIMEADGSFTLFVDTDDKLVGSLFAKVDGMAGPSWQGVKSAPGSVPTNQWCKVVFHFDGITQARLFIDDVAVATRTDFASGVAGVGGAGIVIGNWTLADQFTFAGQIDRVRFLKREDASAVQNFTTRPISPAARDHWDDIWKCLNPDDDGGELAAQLAWIGREWEKLLRQLFRAAHADPIERQILLQAIDSYRSNWLANTIDGQGMVDALLSLRDLIDRLLGSAWLAKAEQIAEAVRDLYSGSSCIDPGELEAVDPEFVRMISNAKAVL